MIVFLAVALALIVGFGGCLGVFIVGRTVVAGFRGEWPRLIGTTEHHDDVLEAAIEGRRRFLRDTLEAAQWIALALTAAAVLVVWSSP